MKNHQSSRYSPIKKYSNDIHRAMNLESSAKLQTYIDEILSSLDSKLDDSPTNNALLHALSCLTPIDGLGYTVAGAQENCAVICKYLETECLELKSPVVKGKVIWDNMTPESYEALSLEEKEIVDIAHATEFIAMDRAVDITKWYGKQNDDAEYVDKIAHIVYSLYGGENSLDLEEVAPEDKALAIRLIELYWN